MMIHHTIFKHCKTEAKVKLTTVKAGYKFTQLITIRETNSHGLRVKKKKKRIIEKVTSKNTERT